jgi:nitroreductase
MELFEAMYTLRSMRRLKPDPVPDEAVRTILDAAIRAASGGNQQQWGFIVVRDRAVKDEIAAIYLAGWKALKASGYGQAPPDAPEEERRRQERVLRSAEHLAEHLADAPVWIFPCARIGAQPPTLTSGSSIYPAVQNLLLAARALGLGTTITTLYRRENARVNALLGLPEGWDNAALIPLGYPEGKWGTAARQPVEAVAYADRFGQPFFAPSWTEGGHSAAPPNREDPEG